METLRPRRFNFCTGGVEAVHGHASEYFIEFLYLMVAVVQLAVCPGFYSTASTDFYALACWAFAVTGLIVVVLSLHTMSAE